MIIACEQCQTRFQLDEGQIPSGGARVRCSKCQHAFFVRPPEVEAETTFDGVVAETVDEAIPVPEPEAAAALGQTDPSLSSALEPVGEVPPEEWTFNEEPPTGMAAAVPAARDGDPEVGMEFDPAAPGDLFGTPGDLGSSGTFRTPPGEEAAAPAADETPAAEFDLGRGESEEAPPLPGSPSAHPGSGEAHAQPTAAPEGEAPLGELGDPTEWDFLADAVPAVHTAEAVAEEAAEVREAPAEVARPRKPLPWFVPARPAEALAWLLAVGLTTGGLFQVVRGVANPPARAPVAVTVVAGAPSAEDVRARSLENLHVGPILVVEGRLASGTQGEATRVRLLDAAGEPLPGIAAWAGPALPESSLREEEPAQLRARLTRGAAGLAAGGSFQAVFPTVPELARAVALSGEPAPSLRTTSRPPTPPEPAPSPE